MYLGEFNIDDYIDIVATTHRFSSGAVYAPTGDVTYTVYENANATQIITATAMTNFDSETGLYFDRIQATVALGYEAGKSYMVLIKATVDGVASIDWRTFKVKATITATLDTVKADTVEILTRIPDATAGAEGGLPTVAAGGVKLAQTVDLTAGQSIACSDKTGFSLSATGADLILKSSTFVQSIVAAVNEFATYGLTALNTLLVTTGIKAASIPAATLVADQAVNATKIGGTTQTGADLGARIPGIQKNAALNNFEFLMLDSSDHVTPKTGLTITAQRSIDGAAFGSCANAASEVSNGVYKINLAAADLNGGVVTLLFTASGADARLITIRTTA